MAVIFNMGVVEQKILTGRKREVRDFFKQAINGSLIKRMVQRGFIDHNRSNPDIETHTHQF